MARLEGKTAIVTGGNHGIGRATAELFCKEGAKVVIVGRRETANEETVRMIAAAGGEISSVAADLMKPEDCRRVAEETVAKYGRIDILVNNAAIPDMHRPVTRCDEAWYDKIVRTDQYSVYYMCRYVLPYMEKEGKGSVVNVSSIGSAGIAGISYSAAKGAVNSMTKNIAIQYAATDIRCNAVAPGPTPVE